MRTRLPHALWLVLLLAACAGSPHEAPPRAGDDPIVLVEYHPGLAPAAAVWALPQFALLADGTALTATDDRGILLSATRRTLTADQVADLYDRAGDAGLFRSREYSSDVLDASALVVRITSDRGRHETVVVQPSARDRGGRGRAVRFADEATQLGTPAGEYLPDRVAAIVVAGRDDNSDVRPWPLPVPASEMPGYPSRPCLIVSGAGVAPLLAVARNATAETAFSSAGQALSLRVRPLLPYEHSCADL